MRKTGKKLLIISTTLCILLGLFYFDWMQRPRNPPDEGSAQNRNAQQHRKALIKYFCLENHLSNSSARISPFVARQLYVEHSHKLIYCEVPKVGCSNWKRVLLLLNSSLRAQAGELQHDHVHSTPLLTRLSAYSSTDQRHLLNNYTTVMFTRHPFIRLLSAYRDKFLHDEPYYSKTIADIIKARVRKTKNSSDKVTFKEFVEFIAQENPKHRDTHWKPMYQLCDPCNIQYDFVGRFETMNEDAEYFLKVIGAPKHLTFPNIRHYPNETRINRSQSLEYFGHLTTRLRQCLAQIYRLDFSMFEYKPTEL